MECSIPWRLPALNKVSYLYRFFFTGAITQMCYVFFHLLMFLLSRSKSEYGDCTLEQVIIMQDMLYCGLEGQLKRSREWKSLLSRKEMSVMPLCAEQGTHSSIDKNAEAVTSCVS